MTSYSLKITTLLFLLSSLFLSFLATPVEHFRVYTRVKQEDLYYIKHSNTGLYLDASDRIVTAQPYTGDSEQKWDVDCNASGSCTITNDANGMVLDIDDAHRGIFRNAHVVTSRNHRGNHQIWYLATDGTISNGASRRMVIELDNNDHAAMGSRSRYGRSNQIFEVIEIDETPCGSCI